MTRPKAFSCLATMLIGALGVWVVIYAAGGDKWTAMDTEELAAVQGCFSARGKLLLRIKDKTLYSNGRIWGFEGQHEKSRDVLVMNGPLQVSSGTEPKLVAASTVTKVGIVDGIPLKLELWDDQNRLVHAKKVECPS